jgi:DNA-binding PadR family transcriptional regulator
MSPAYFHILLALSKGPRHGYAMMHEIEHFTEGRVALGPSSLYYSLSRLVEQGLIRESAAGHDDDAPHEGRRRYYELTEAGRALLASESAVLADIVDHARALGIVGGRA